jgi:hypothetical protein
MSQESDNHACSYLVTDPFAAIDSKNGRFLTVRRGSVLAIENPVKEFGLTEAVCAEQHLFVFSRDIEACAERIVDMRATETI